MLEDFINAFQNFARNKTRTILSLLGVIIGVASVIVITSMGASSTKQIQDTFGSSGLDQVTIQKGYMSKRKKSGITVDFNEAFRTNIFNNIDNIKQVWFKNSFSATLSYGDTSVSSSVTAIEPDFLQMCNLVLDYGDFFSVTDDVIGNQKIILGSEVASGLFPEGNAVGKVITVVSSNITFAFTVAGVLKEQSAGFENVKTGVYVPMGFYTKKIKPNSPASSVILQAVNKSATTQMVNDVINYMTSVTGYSNAVNVNSMQTMMDQMSSITNTLSLMLSAIAAISLLVGGIGIMNIMIVTVTERRQEIGIRKALGATPAAIKQQFLIESASITLTGGIIGVILGVLISIAVEYVKGESFVINWKACVISFVFSVLVGIFFGLNPASRAAKLDPVVALNN